MVFLCTKRVDNNKKDYLKWTSKPSFETKNISQNLVAIRKQHMLTNQHMFEFVY